MKKTFMSIVLVCSLLLNSALALAQGPHADTVSSVKAALVMRGVSLSDSCGAFEITKRVAWQLRGEGAGILNKTSGNNCQGYSVDIIVYPGGAAFDILGDAGGANNPSWNPVGVNASDYRPAFDPGDVTGSNPGPTPGPVVIVPPAPPVDLSQVYNKLDSLYAQAERIFAAQEVEVQARNAQLDVLNAKVQQHIDETHSFIDKVGSFFTDGKTITAIVAGLGTYIATTRGK
jgi:hypothetical protein